MLGPLPQDEQPPRGRLRLRLPPVLSPEAGPAALGALPALRGGFRRPQRVHPHEDPAGDAPSADHRVPAHGPPALHADEGESVPQDQGRRAGSVAAARLIARFPIVPEGAGGQSAEGSAQADAGVSVFGREDRGSDVPEAAGLHDVQVAGPAEGDVRGVLFEVEPEDERVLQSVDSAAESAHHDRHAVELVVVPQVDLQAAVLGQS